MNKVLSAIIILCLIFVGPSVNASNGNDGKSKVKKPKIYVEVLYNNGGFSKIEETILDDGTKVGDYDYEVLYSTPLSMNVLDARISSYMTGSPISTYFNYAAWITRDGVVSLSLDPKANTRANGVANQEGWSALANPTHGFGSHYNWTTKKAFKWQYVCHFEHAKNKARWNIEPSRNAWSYAHVVAIGCNP